MACSHVLSTPEQLSLPPPPIDLFAVLGGRGLWSCGGRTGGSDGQRSGDPRGGGMDALEERWRTGRWHSPVRSVK